LFPPGVTMSENVPGARSALRGFYQGVACCLVGFAALRLAMVGTQAFEEWGPLLGLSLLGGLVFAVGGAIAGSVAGSLLGAVAGVFLGGAAGSMLPPVMVAREIEDRSEPGPEFDLKGPGLDGKPIDVADYRGKIVLVDFWATWCLPCVQELPNVQEAYKKYHPGGFEVVGVSLDNDRADLEEFLKRRPLPWRQVFIDRSGWVEGRNPLAVRYGVDAIPATFLLDREGRVVARGLRGAELGRAVERLLGQTEPGKRVEQLNVTPYFGLALGGLAFAILGALFQRLSMTAAKPS
jgi:thiol-disulfide isomerase/thioredoxin